MHTVCNSSRRPLLLWWIRTCFKYLHSQLHFIKFDLKLGNASKEIIRMSKKAFIVFEIVMNFDDNFSSVHGLAEFLQPICVCHVCALGGRANCLFCACEQFEHTKRKQIYFHFFFLQFLFLFKKKNVFFTLSLRRHKSESHLSSIILEWIGDIIPC